MQRPSTAQAKNQSAQEFYIPQIYKPKTKKAANTKVAKPSQTAQYVQANKNSTRDQEESKEARNVSNSNEAFYGRC